MIEPALTPDERAELWANEADRLQSEVSRLRRDRREFLTLIAGIIRAEGRTMVRLPPYLLNEVEDATLSVSTDNKTGAKTVAVGNLTLRT